MFRVPFVNYSLQYCNLENEINAAIKSALNKGDLILRKDLEEFENNLANFVKTKYAVALNSGTDALFLSLKAANIGEGDEVITVSHTFLASISAIVQAGATPILVDVKEDFLIDIDQIEGAVTLKTRAIMPIHLNGRVCDMERLMDIAQKNNLIVIEDVAQALGAKLLIKGANLQGAGSFGLTGCFSFYPAKILGGLGDGGAVVTDNPEIAEKIRLLRDHGQKTKTEIICYGWNSRLDNLQAAVLNVKFKYLPEWIKKRREIAKIYNQGLSGISQIKLPPAPDSDPRRFDVYQNYVLRTERRDELFVALKNNGVETLIKDPIPNHWQRNLGLSHFHLPLTEQLAKEVISLPMFPELTNSQVEYVINKIKDFYAKGSL